MELAVNKSVEPKSFKFLSCLQAALKICNEVEALKMASSLAYYISLSFAPLVLLVLVVGRFIFSDFDTEFSQHISSFMSDSAKNVLQKVVGTRQAELKGSALSIVAVLITLLFSSSAIFTELRSSLNRIFEIQNSDVESSAFLTIIYAIKERLLSVGLVVSFVLLVMFSTVASWIFLSFAPTDIQALGMLINLSLSLAIYSLVFTLMYRYVPSVSQDFRNSAKAGILTAILFWLGKILIEVYLSTTATESIYGSAGSFIAFLIWSYYSSMIVFFSACFNKAWIQK